MFKTVPFDEGKGRDMNNLQVFENIEFGRLEVYEINGKPYFPATKCAEVLGYSNSRQAVIDHCKETIEHKALTKGGLQTIKVITKDDLRQLVARSRMPVAKELADKLGMDCFCSTKEQDCLSVIIAAFSHLKSISQYQVGRFRIDLYFPERRLAVECDENNHNHSQYASDDARQKYIESVLGCRFVRFNPDEPGFNVGSVINQIMLEVAA